MGGGHGEIEEKIWHEREYSEGKSDAGGRGGIVENCCICQHRRNYLPLQTFLQIILFFYSDLGS